VKAVFEPAEAGKPFVTIHITGCVVEGEYPVEGTQVCELPGGETEATEHEVDCKPAGSKLVLKGLPAEYEGKAKVKLKPVAKKFSAK